MLHQSLKLYINDETFTVVPEFYDPEVSREVIVIDRSTGKLHCTAEASTHAKRENVWTIYGIMGFIKLLAGEYMIVITNRKRVGQIRGQDIYRITSFEIVPFVKDLSSLTPEQAADEQRYVDLLTNHLKINTFYVSYTYDLTHSIQRQAQFSEETMKQVLSQRADDRFFWNKFISSKLIDTAKTTENPSELYKYILPVMQGFVEVIPTTINKKKLVFGLITRRNRYRPGTRYFSRGIDANGHVSNFVETEQFVLYDGENETSSNVVEGKIQLSYVQTRGSIPVYWAQVINSKYTPKLWLGDSRKSLEASRAHFDEQIAIYGPQLLVNLVNKKGYELPMGQAYARNVEQLNDHRLIYTHFDFHNECRKMRWDRISLLLDQLEPELAKQSYSYYDATNNNSPVLQKTQTSVVRTNCMDCLDRTNVVQSTLARYVLNQQLRKIKVLDVNEKIEEHEDFMVSFRNIWADNADAVSFTYSGTGALKTDFTRTGQRSKAGALQDLSNSITRYVKNNYLDGSRQDGFDLFLGNYTVNPLKEGKYVSPFQTEKALRVRVVPAILVFAFIMLLVNLIFPRTSGSNSTFMYLMVVSFWFSVLVSGVRYIVQNGSQFVQWPKLLPTGPKRDQVTFEKATIKKPVDDIPLKTLS
ncbi:SacI homology domain-containing protein [Umbelopsis sp. PMI_123]|nr:SacI homology domain-containing protein [Umbelopsis sp. PMI_123]